MQFGIFTVGDVTTDPTTGTTVSEHERIKGTIAIAKKVEELVKVSYEGMPLALRQSRFAARRRPRAKGKPVWSQQASESKTRR